MLTCLPVFPSYFSLTCASFVQLPGSLFWPLPAPHGVKTPGNRQALCDAGLVPSRPSQLWRRTARKWRLCRSWWGRQCWRCCHLSRSSTLSWCRMSPRILSWVIVAAWTTVWPLCPACPALGPDFSCYIRERGTFYHSVGLSTFFMHGTISPLCGQVFCNSCWPRTFGFTFLL